MVVGGTAKSPGDNNWGLLIPAGMLLFLLVSTYFGTKSQMVSNKSLNERFHYLFNEIGVYVTAPSSSGHTSWANIRTANETGSNFLIFISKNMKYTIPKRCFVDDSQMDRFRQLLKSQLSSKAKLK